MLARYGGVVAGLAVLVILGAGGWQGWRWWQGQEATKAGAAYLAASQATTAPEPDRKALADRFASLAAAAPEGYRVLALLRTAALQAEAGEREAALASWDRVAKDASADPLYRDLATLLWGMHALDGGDAAAIESRLAPLANGPWRASAAEVLALAALQRGETEQAKQRLTALAADPLAPQGVRDRAGRLLAGLGG
nr:tetratricopeptide repeat protein [Siccirubricoccus soli]